LTPPRERDHWERCWTNCWPYRPARFEGREYLRRGIEEIRAGAAFVFAKDEERFSRYPQLRLGLRRRQSDNKEEKPSQAADDPQEAESQPQEADPVPTV
jgi:hypothetical protein